ncbi:hypothetical protein ONE63_007866 [Megalurothrips usitatus]|uniref:Farnesol dehydrogenase-like n=1 Tax=Megalurothrips usitatus TaxID=439358 RepID=A0AAV7XP04_9NEOP|nr:hypothetical protein ONE63_007866 [Megalurothrips usitatus]
MDRFAGRVALVTGVSSGIGAVVAELLVRAGVAVVGVARREQRLQELAAKLAGEKGKLHPLPADLSRPEEVRRVYQWVEDNLGGVAIVVNNAAVLSLVPLQDTDAAAVQQLVNTNLTSVMLSCREALQSMKKHGTKDGHIINVNSIAGHRAINITPYSVTAYGATKHGITALSQGLRYDAQMMEGFKIRVTSISPGSVSTEMTPPQTLEYMKDPDDILKATDVAEAILYVLSCPPAVEISELTIHATRERV